MASKEHRAQIADAAQRALKHHVLITKGLSSGDVAVPYNPLEAKMGLRPYVWLCRHEDRSSWPYWFYVAELPGAIVQYGDIGGLLIEQGSSYDLEWLSGAINSMDYVLSKSKAQRNYFVEDAFKEYVKEHGHDPDEFECYEDYVMQTGNGEGYEVCHDWSADTLWAYWALRRFCELRRA